MHFCGGSMETFAENIENLYWSESLRKSITMVFEPQTEMGSKQITSFKKKQVFFYIYLIFF